MTAFNLEVLLLLLAAFALGVAVGLWLRRSRQSVGEGEVMVPVPSSLQAQREPPASAPAADPAPPGAPVAQSPSKPEADAPSAPPPAAERPLPPLREPVADLFGHLLNVQPGALAEEPALPRRGVAAREGENHPGVQPPVLAAPEGGLADDLKELRGIGPQNERRLHGLGIFHFRQIAAWTPEEAAWVGSYLAFPGRIEREDWIGQARTLAARAQKPQA
ncbi:hypothetical protein [Xanthobacter sediminis]|uniref:hypothetical protein n=1 Tax=Xanthobacter sediminis TaxID=3119926 RepID=UPI0037285E78